MERRVNKARAYIGDIVRDRVTGFQGMAIARTLWLNGCARLGVQRQDLHEGVPQDTQWFDDNQLEVITKNAAPWADNVEPIEPRIALMKEPTVSGVPHTADVTEEAPELTASRPPGGPRDDPKGPRS